ncbi:MAG TPA: aminotransferase class V-fold PLP-dependent enzyme [Terriglobales bacterium]|nr:aminotransferase class V-fold PLP-dependent enzyme [Terriglobales bacterium]
MTNVQAGLQAIRSRFPVFRNSIYLNSCSQGALSDAVEEAMQKLLEMWRYQGSPWDEWVQEYEVARGEFADFIGAEADEIALVPSVSAGVSSLATAFDFSARKTVLMSEFEFPTMGHVWLAQQRRGANVKFLRAQGEQLPPSLYDQAIDNDTLIVPVTGICFKNGFRSHLSEITAAAHARGAYVLLDDYQDCGTRPRNVRELDVDFYTSGTLKYLLGPSGLAFLYVRKSLISKLQPSVAGWFSQQSPFDFATERFEPAASARRFQSGTPPIPNVYMALAGLRLLREIGFQNVAAHVAQLTSALLEGVQELGMRAKTPANSVGPLVVLQSHDAEAMVKALAREGFICSSRHDGLRISFHIYNSMEDVELLLKALARNAELMVQSRSVTTASR